MKTSVQSQRLPSDRDLNRWIKRVALILVVGAIAFTAFYVIDRWRPAAAPIVDRELAALEDAVRANPGDVAARGGLADTYAKKGRYAEAITQYTKILETDQFTERARFGRGSAYLAIGELDSAAQDFLAVVEIGKAGEMAVADPTLQAAYFGLGTIAMKQDKPADAVGYLERALVINRADADSMYLLAKAYIATGRPGDAITLLRASVAFVPIGWSEPYAAMAEAYTQSGKPELAAWARAMVDAASGKPEAAEAALKPLVDGPAALDASIGLGLVYESVGRPAEAATWYQKAITLDPQNTTANMGLGRVSPAATSKPLASPGGTPK